jgi:hypothetical protein
MGDAHARAPGAGARVRGAPRAGYRVELLQEARTAPEGIHHRAGGEPCLLRWDEVWFAVAAEVGEPEGVRTVVFDLVLGCDAQGWRAARLDAEPGTDAEEIARAIHSGVGPRQRGPSIKSLAGDGVPSWWYADLEGFEEAVLAAIPSMREER